MTFILGTNPFVRDGPAASGKDLHTAADRERRNAVLEDNMLWPGGIIPYEISSVFNGIITIIAKSYYLLLF